MTDPETHAAQLEFAQRLGVTMIDVWFLSPRDKRWRVEPQVDDHDTFLETVNMSAGRGGARFALWFDEEQWCLLDRHTGDTKRYPSRAAAEMVAFHVR